MRFLKGKVAVIATFFAVLIVLGFVSSRLEKRATVEASGMQAPMFEVDPMWPKPLPNHWLLGMTIGVSVDSQDTSGSFTAKDRSIPRKPTAGDASGLRLLPPAPPVLEFDQAGNLIQLGRPGTGLRLADIQPRHHRGLQRQRVDRRQRGGSADGDGQVGFARTTDSEVYPGWEVPDADRQAWEEPGQQRSREPAETGEDVCRSGDERGVCRRWLRQ